MNKINETKLGEFTVIALTKNDLEIVKRMDKKSGKNLSDLLKNSVSCVFGIFDNTFSDRELLAYCVLSASEFAGAATISIKDMYVSNLPNDILAIDVCTSFISIAIDIKIHNTAMDLENEITKINITDPSIQMPVRTAFMMLGFEYEDDTYVKFL